MSGPSLARTWIVGLVRARSSRLVGIVAGTMMSVLIVAALGAFFSASKSSMTAAASRETSVDWQVQLSPNANLVKTLDQILSTKGVLRAAPVAYADVPSFSATSNGSTQTTGAGKVVGLPPGYANVFRGQIRMLIGSTDGVILSQQTAANLHAVLGEIITIARPGVKPIKAVVSGVVDLPHADSFFQHVGASVGAAPSAPPDNVALLSLGTWHSFFDPVVLHDPSAIRMQIHVTISHALPSDPSAAFAEVVGHARNLEASLAGAGLVGDNLGARLDATRSDAVYSQLLFLFLGLPGVVVAGLITAVVAASGRDRRKREQALLRVRGATPRIIVRLAAAEAITAAVLGIGLGLGIAALVGRAAFGTARFGATFGQAIVWIVAAAVVGLGLSLATILIPAWVDAHRSVRHVDRNVKPLWARLYLDVLVLAAAGFVYWQAVRSGYQVVLAPEGVPTISVGTFTLLAPLLLWLGSALLAWRIAAASLKRGRRVIASMSRSMAGNLSGVVAASMVRQRRLLSRTLVITALAVSFAVSTSVFNTTYAAQARVDARLTNGADVAVSTSPGGALDPGIVSRVRGIPGVAAVDSIQHRYAYVGNDLQDLFGIDPRTIGQAASISNAFFKGGNARAALGLLARSPDGVLVSDETVKDFQLQPGDLVRLRLQTATDHSYHVVPFHYIGIAREFPTAPHDSFLIVNASYVARMTGIAAPQTLLIRANDSPPVVAARVRSIVDPASGATVSDIVAELRTTLSSLTAVDLAGLTRLQLGFAVALAIAATGLVLWLGFGERRRTFAIASALGAQRKQLAAFVWTEATFVTAGGMLLGAISGWGIAFVIVKILTGVFDPPPEHLTVPWAYLGSVVIAAVVGIVVASAATVRAASEPAIEIIRDL